MLSIHFNAETSIRSRPLKASEEDLLKEYERAVPLQINASVQNAQGAKWIRQSEASWNMLIGAGEGQEYEYHCYMEYVNVAYEYDDACWTCSDHHHIDYANNQTETYVTLQEVCLSRHVSGRSDGLVTEESARSWQGCQVRVDGCNHQELLNHPVSANVFLRIFNKNLIEPEGACSEINQQFFKIEERL